MEIKLTNSDKVTIIDDDDFVILPDTNWRISPFDYIISSRNFQHSDGKFRPFFLHRLILRNYDKKLMGDHISGNRLDNRKENLRLCSPQDNLRNRHKKQSNSRHSKYFGVSIANGKWKAYIGVDSKYIHLGYHKTEEDAARAYNKKAEELGFLTRNIINE